MAAQDTFGHAEVESSGPAVHAVAITPNDGADIAVVTRAVYVGGAGNLSVVMSSGDSVVFSGVLAGSVLPIRVSRVNATGTTATNIVGLY